MGKVNLLIAARSQSSGLVSGKTRGLYSEGGVSPLTNIVGWVLKRGLIYWAENQMGLEKG